MRSFIVNLPVIRLPLPPPEGSASQEELHNFTIGVEQVGEEAKIQWTVYAALYGYMYVEATSIAIMRAEQSRAAELGLADPPLDPNIPRWKQLWDREQAKKHKAELELEQKQQGQPQ